MIRSPHRLAVCAMSAALVLTVLSRPKLFAQADELPGERGALNRPMCGTTSLTG